MRLTIVRHAFAGHTGDWKGRDLDRPLDARGRREALGLAAVIARHRVARIVSSPAIRCTQTMQPLADVGAVPVETWSALGPDGSASEIITGCFAHPAFDDAVLCTHGEVMQPLLQLESVRVAARKGRLTKDRLLTKATAWRLHLDDEGQVTKLVHLTPG
jgi:8-oxo-dGTP diphosphatase